MSSSCCSVDKQHQGLLSEIASDTAPAEFGKTVYRDNPTDFGQPVIVLSFCQNRGKHERAGVLRDANGFGNLLTAVSFLTKQRSCAKRIFIKSSLDQILDQILGLIKQRRRSKPDEKSVSGYLAFIKCHAVCVRTRYRSQPNTPAQNVTQTRISRMKCSFDIFAPKCGFRSFRWTLSSISLHSFHTTPVSRQSERGASVLSRFSIS